MTEKQGATSHKRSVVIAGHATSVSLEPEFWDALKRLAARDGVSLNTLIARIDAERTRPLSSAIRVYVLESLQGRSSQASGSGNAAR